MIKYLVVCIIIHIFAEPYAISVGKGRENCQQINTTMNIQDIKNSFIGKKIRFYDGHSGALIGFKIGSVVEIIGGDLMFEPCGIGTARIFIRKDRAEELLNAGYTCSVDERRNYKVEWSIE